MSNKLRIGLLVENRSVKKFELSIINKIKTLDCCEIVLILDNINPIISKKSSFFNFYQKIDRFIYAKGVNYLAEETIDIDNLKILSFKAIIEKDNAIADTNTITAIKDKKIDLIVKFDPTVYKGDILSSSKYGVWEFSYGKASTTANLAGLSETINGEKSLFVTLQKLPDENNNGYIVDSFNAVADEISFFNNQNQLCWKTHILMPRNIQRLAKNPKKFISYRSQDLLFYKDKIEKYPTNFTMIKPIFSFLLKNITSRIDRLFYKSQWSIYFAENEKKNPFQRDLSKFIKIETPKHLFWADPFVIDKDDKSYIFFEDYVYKTRKGHISCIEYNHKTRNVSAPKVIIDTNYHQSYPFIIEYEDEIYMIPEGSKDKDVKLYKAKNFPYEWEIVYSCFNGKEVVDTTLFFHDNKWWLFANMIEEPGHSLNEELYIYYSDDFRINNWKPHACNPVISDIQTSRPAGKIISYNGVLYRPSQNSVGGYGYGTNFNKILKLTPEDYSEEFVSEITPDFISDAKAIHTYNSSDKLTVIDVVHKIGRFF